MRLIVDDLPRTPKECLFGWKHIEYSKWRCKFGRECELSAECRQCSHLVTFATDTNVGTKLSTNLAQLGTDCISRQQAIDALAKNMPSWTTPDGSGQFDHDIQVTDEAYVDCMQIIHDMPSAQPEIIRCKDCNHFYKDNLNQWCFLGKYGVKENDFCSRAERRTDE